LLLGMGVSDDNGGKGESGNLHDAS
jgi:hypothetical protein